MMTEQRKLRLKRKIHASRARMLNRKTFFAVLLMYLKFVAVSDIKKISTNGKSIYFNPQFIEKLNDDELDYILCHQLIHILCGHIWRCNDLDGDNYHFSCDIFVNRILLEFDFEYDRFSHLGYLYDYIPGYIDVDLSDKTTEDVYRLLPFNLYFFDEKIRNKYVPDDDFWWGKTEDRFEKREVIIDLPEISNIIQDKDKNEKQMPSDEKTETKKKGGVLVTPDNEINSDKESLKHKWLSLAAAAMNAIKTEGNNHFSAGDTPEFLKRFVNNTQNSVLDWRKILNDFIQERVCDYSFSPPDRRYSDGVFFLPDFNEKEYVAADILFMVDTSASVTDDELELIYSEIKGAVEQFNGKLKGMLGFFDSKVTEPLPFENVTQLKSIVPVGGGGTDFRVIFDYICSLKCEGLPSCIIIFTDGCGPYPDESAALGIPALWIINNNCYEPPWGKTVRLIHEYNDLD